MTHLYELIYFERLVGRYWLERLIRATTYVSGLDQAASAISKSVSALHTNDEYLTVASHLEDLLLHRISKEWGNRSSISSIMAQFLFSLNLGGYAFSSLHNIG